MGLYRRSDSGFWWVVYRDGSGRRRHASTGTTDERAAQAILARLEAMVRAGNAPVRTVADYIDVWTERRVRSGQSNAQLEQRRMKRHGAALLGLPLRDVTTRDVRDLLVSLKAKMGVGDDNLAPRTVNHVMASLANVFESAVEDELIGSNPARLKRGELPRKADKDPLWRSTAVYTRAEVVQLISDERIPQSRRVIYALGLLAGLRLGEVGALRWEAIDMDVEPLGRLTVARSYDRINHREKSTKTGIVREVPVHPTLAAVLAAWRLVRAPQPGDLVVSTDAGGYVTDSVVWPGLSKDLETLGLRHRRFHDMRRAFISLLIGDGAPKDVVVWLTHSGKTGNVVDEYTSLSWPAKCAAVRCLKVSMRSGAKVRRM